MPSSILGKPKSKPESGLKKLLRSLGLPFEDKDLEKLLGSGEAKRSVNKLKEARRKRKEFLDKQ
jgi:hypothetical protein